MDYQLSVAFVLVPKESTSWLSVMNVKQSDWCDNMPICLYNYASIVSGDETNRNLLHRVRLVLRMSFREDHVLPGYRTNKGQRWLDSVATKSYFVVVWIVIWMLLLLGRF